MCFNDKCIFCIPVEIGSLLLGIFTSILNAIGIFGCVVGLIYVNISQITVSVATNVGLAFGFLLFTIDFGFSVALADGASKKKSGHVKSYFVYGVVKSVLALIISIIVVAVIGTPAFLMLIPLVLYCALLVMVYQTYTKFDYAFPYGGLVVASTISAGERVQLV